MRVGCEIQFILIQFETKRVNTVRCASLNVADDILCHWCHTDTVENWMEIYVGWNRNVRGMNLLYYVMG